MNLNERHGGRVRLTAIVAAVLLLAAGTVMFAIGLDRPGRPPQPDAALAAPTAAVSTESPPGSATKMPTSSTPSATKTTPSATKKTPKTTGPVLTRSAPTRLDIPSIGVSSAMLRLGINPDKTIQVPPLDADSKAGWYQYSPTPGQLGPSIILGHVDSAKYGPGIFYRLGALKPGATISITRADNTTAVFNVDRTVSYPKNSFPTLQVYGNTDHAALRLITCGGTFDLSTRNYSNNIVTYATLISSHPA